MYISTLEKHTVSDPGPESKNAVGLKNDWLHADEFAVRLCPASETPPT
jgi:hypothetical protein